MSNPYSPPKAAVGDVGAAPELARMVQILRAATVVVDAVIALSLLLFLFTARVRLDLEWALVIGAGLLWAGGSIAALVARFAPRVLFWLAMLLNGVIAAFFAYTYFTTKQTPDLALVLIVPSILNMTAIELLRRARARLASG